MKVIITGMNGTVAPVVAKHFNQNGYEIIQYNRDLVSTTNIVEIDDFIKINKPNFLLHFAMGSIAWTQMLASVCNKYHILFVYISTVSVFSNEFLGPHMITAIPDATDEYGKYKIACEVITKEYHDNPYIIRLGWQIGYSKDNNQMINFLYQKMAEDGVIKASNLWYPSVSFLDDTAKAIYQILHEFKPGIFHVNSNDKCTYYEIVSYLSTIYPEFKVEVSNDFSADHRMVDDRVKIKKISEYIKK